MGKHNIQAKEQNKTKQNKQIKTKQGQQKRTTTLTTKEHKSFTYCYLFSISQLHISHNALYLPPPPPQTFAQPSFFNPPGYNNCPIENHAYVNCFFWRGGGGQIRYNMGDVQVEYRLVFGEVTLSVVQNA